MAASLVYQAPPRCPSAETFRHRVAGWLDVSDDAAAGLVGGRLQLDARPEAAVDRVYQGHATLPKSGATRDLHAATCDELVTAFAFVFAVDLDERVLERASLGSPSPPSPPPPPAPAPTPLAHDRRIAWYLAALSGVSGGLSPHATPSEGIDVEARLARDDDGGDEKGLVVSPRLRVGFAFDVPATTTVSLVSGDEVAELGTRFSTLRARLDLCPVAFVQRLVDLSVCARADANLIVASGSDYAGARSVSDGLFALGGSGRLAFRLAARWSLGVDGGLVAPVARDRFTVQSGDALAYTTSLLTESAQLFVVWRFR